MYDVTSYLAYHPGGKEAILPYCGKDATAAFVGKPHSPEAYNLLQSFYLGELNGYVVSRPLNIEKNVTEVVRRYFGDGVKIVKIEPEYGGYEVTVDINGLFVEVYVRDGMVYPED